ncbi:MULTISPECIES: DedA family protein [unclassified Roseateles]|uniref:DedA family protein n=1 Tax=unclassified Roseateles TaxID=2626991 RepID=UPI0006F5475E|nr:MULTISPECIES: DedA family protein [unclassified Roseateles]KQW45312.1 alkaline phosphatase [Pelomonas sp. Root405]KRA72157.1 alkaline phosphatase [Pelomonas sp. Root662]
MADWVIRFIEEYGYLGVSLLMVAENIFPPLPSELIMPFAAFQAARGELHWVLVVFAGAAGSLVGALPWYYVGRRVGLERVLRFSDRYGRWLTLKREDIERAEEWFVNKGTAALVFGRLVPALRTVISLPAGISRLPFWRFCLWTAVGSVLWCSALTAAGFVLESQYERIGKVMGPVSTGIVVVLVVWYAWRVIRFRH